MKMKLKKNSSRQPLSQKYTIEKKVRDHDRKLKKTAIKSAKLLRRTSKLKKRAFTIPNSYPFKSELLSQIQTEKADSRAAQKVKRLEMAANANMPATAIAEQLEVDENDSYALLLNTALAKQDKSEMYERSIVKHPNSKSYVCISIVKPVDVKISQKPHNCTMHIHTVDCHIDNEQSMGEFPQDSMETNTENNMGKDGESKPKKPRKKYNFRDLYKLIQQSDVLIEVLDARDPLSTRSKAMENHIIAQNKKLVLLINKVDLVPNECLQKWIPYLQRDYPTVAFKSVIGTASAVYQNPVNILHASEGLKKKKSEVLGANDLMSLLNNYARTSDGKYKKSISVGIFGFPNTGKSSVINSLTRSTRGAPTGSLCGLTKHLQTYSLDKHIKLVDSAGVIMYGDVQDPGIVLLNAANSATVEDPQAVVECLVSRCPTAQLAALYKVAPFSTTYEFLNNLAIARGKLIQKGVPNITAAAKIAINEFVRGSVRFHCLPPKEEDGHAESKIVSTEDVEME